MHAKKRRPHSRKSPGYRHLAVLALVLPIAGCPCRSRRPTRPNQEQPSVSPNGKYVVTVPIERNPNYRNTPVWKVTICDTQGNRVYKDEDSHFVGHLNVYWIWDETDRLWLYNSDTGDVLLWEADRSGEWTKTKWGHGHTRTINRDLVPPEALYPDYAKRSATTRPAHPPRTMPRP